MNVKALTLQVTAKQRIIIKKENIDQHNEAALLKRFGYKTIANPYELVYAKWGSLGHINSWFWFSEKSSHILFEDFYFFYKSIAVDCILNK